MRPGIFRSRKPHGVMLAIPALSLVALLLFLPLIWLAVISFQDPQGALSLDNYRRVMREPAIVATYLMTFKISVSVTLICILLGYPLAYMIASLPRKWAVPALLAVTLPFWTSTLVRTYAWIILLQRRGVVNTWLIDRGLIDQPLALAYSFTGVVIGMVHIMLPFFVLPLYATLSSIDSSFMRAAASLGAGPFRAFWTVYFPLSLPGVLAGTVLVLVLCLGFYVTPALLGGGRVLVIAMAIERAAAQYASWGVAAALGITLLAATVLSLGLGWFVTRQGRRTRA